MWIDVISLHENLKVAASPELKAAVQAAALSRGMTVADYVRIAAVEALARDGRGFPRMRDHARLGMATPRRSSPNPVRN